MNILNSSDWNTEFYNSKITSWVKISQLFPAEFQQDGSVLSFPGDRSWRLFFFICCGIAVNPVKTDILKKITYTFVLNNKFYR